MKLKPFLHRSKDGWANLYRNLSSIKILAPNHELNLLQVRQKSSTPLKWSYLMGPCEKPLLGLTIGGVIDRAADKFGDNEAVISRHQNIRKSFTQLREDVDKMAAGLLALGFKKGDRIGIWSPNNYQWYLTEFAAGKAGLVLVNINPSYRPEELKFCLNKVSVKGLICADKFKTSDYHQLLSEVVPELASSNAGQTIQSKTVPSLQTVITMRSTPTNGAFLFDDLLDAGGSNERKEIERLSTIIQFDEPYNIQFTSGTTGLPKGAVLSHHNVINNADAMGRRYNFEQKPLRICIAVPLYHCFGCVIGVLTSTLYGCTNIMASDGFDAKAIVQTIAEERVNAIYGTPTMFVDILAEFHDNPVNVESLYSGIMAGAPCPEELVSSLMDELNMKELMVGYGMTETSPVSFHGFPTDPAHLRATTVGYPSDHTEVKVIDQEGRVVPVGEPGELCVRGYSTFLGYWNDDARTAEVFGKDRWLKSGDLATLNEDGYCSIIGRIKDMIIRGGENIYPAELENFYMSHPDILEAQVFGIPDKRMGEEVVMWIRVRPGSDLDADAIRKWSKGQIAHYKIPKYIAEKTEFPVTVTGKVQKFKMKEMAIDELGLNK